MLYSTTMMRFLSTLMIVLILGGCIANAPEELDRLTKEDPQFRQIIIARDHAYNQIQLIKNELLQKKKVLDSQTTKLRQEYDAFSKAQNLKIEQYHSTIEANRNLLKREIETAQAQMSAKSTELNGYMKTLTDVKKVLQESKGLRLSKQEKEKWEERMLMLSEKIRPLSEEIQELRLQIRLKKQKISFLK